MALIQSARLPGWDEEVVPALRKRLESESRTLARRMSAISLSSVDEPQNFSALADFTSRELPPSSSPFVQNNASNGHPQMSFSKEPRTSSDRLLVSSSRINGSAAPAKNAPSPPFQRSRTYSQPYLSDLNGKTNPGSRPKPNGTNKSTRTTDIKPTRIPVASRGRSGSISNHGHSPIPNGNIYQHTSPNLHQNPDLHVVHETLSINSSHSNIALPNRQDSHLLNEPAPFKPGSMSSIAPSNYQSHIGPDEAPPRASNDSEERPFEHWYRGEVSRNGGVGELRMGRRQEMLEIANYGHTIRTKAANARAAAQNEIDDGRWKRKRADSVSGVEAQVRERKRGSLYLDDEHARAIGRVLDESPLTDLDGEDDRSEVGSASEHYMSAHGNYGFTQEVGDISTISAPVPRSTYESRSITPTSTIQRPSSRQRNISSSRTPGPPSRQSSESRIPSPTPMNRGASEPPPLPSTSLSTTPPPVRQRQPSKPTAAAKRSVSPASKKSRMAASKATWEKTLASRKQQEEEANRRSVAYYPTPAEEDMTADAIPSWTQPTPRQGNWDEVVLPAVARKKGLDDHYEKADGSPQPKKLDKKVEPAPGTFGFDHSKYRPPRESPELIPMDEFGRPTQVTEEPEKNETRPDSHQDTPLAQTQNETRPPMRRPSPPSPAPFSDYAPTSEKIIVPTAMVGSQHVDVEQGKPEDEDTGGCCKCVIM